MRNRDRPGQPLTRPGGPLGRWIHGERDLLVGIVIVFASFWLFQRAPIQEPYDSRYAMLLAENLSQHGDFALDRYGLQEPDYRLQRIDGHVYYSFPPGTSVLSAPFVALLRLRGMSAVRANGTYSNAGELRLDAKLSALLMALFAAVAYFTARCRLPIGWSLAVALVATLGTQVFSTTSRSMWSDTWGILLVGVALLLLLQSATRRAPLNAWLTGSLLGVAYIVRPTNALALVGTALYLVWMGRAELGRFLGAVSGWLALLVAYSWHHFHTLLPDYFAAGRLTFENVPAALFGTLLSPARGLFVYVPALGAIAILLLAYRRTLRQRRLAGLAAFVIAFHLVVLSGFSHWWGGYSYGARLTAGLVPWFVLLGVLALDAARAAAGERRSRAVALTIGATSVLLCLGSIAINSIGAFSSDAARWNSVPKDIDAAPERLWSWRHAQFLAPFEEPSPPRLTPPPPP